jgi:hypothetical protein
MEEKQLQHKFRCQQRQAHPTQLAIEQNQRRRARADWRAAELTELPAPLSVRFSVLLIATSSSGQHPQV